MLRTQQKPNNVIVFLSTHPPYRGGIQSALDIGPTLLNQILNWRILLAGIECELLKNLALSLSGFPQCRNHRFGDLDTINVCN